MGLKLYEKYWSMASSDHDTEQERLEQKGTGKAIAAHNPMIQNNLLGNLKRLYKQAGINDWRCEIDHTLTYSEQKTEIMNRYAVDGFKIDKEKRIKRGLAMQKQYHRDKQRDEFPRQQQLDSSSKQADKSVQITEINEYTLSTSESETEKENSWIEDEVSDVEMNK